jgi:hypothetical protein
MFREHTQTLTDEDLDATVATFREWQSNLVCAEGMDEREMEDGAKRVGRWITGGADVATAPDPCFKGRSAIYAWPEGVSKTTATEVWFHEAYHGLSNYLIRQCSVAENQPEEKYEGIRWFAEGTAEYFGNYMAAKIEGRDDYVQVILRKAYNDYRGDPGADFNNAYFQAAGIQLMIERGPSMLKKSRMEATSMTARTWKLLIPDKQSLNTLPRTSARLSSRVEVTNLVRTRSTAKRCSSPRT